MQTKPTLTQVTSLSEMLQRDLNVNKLVKTENSFSKLKDITINQYKYILLLVFKKKYLKLRELLTSLNFQTI